MEELREKMEEMILSSKTEQCKQELGKIVDECFDLILGQQVPEEEVLRKLEEALNSVKDACKT